MEQISKTISSVVDTFQSNPDEKNFLLIIAISCTILFLLKIAGLFIGGDDFTSYTDGNFGDFDFDADGSMDSTEAFEVLSFQSILAFGMMFGWSGLAARYEYGKTFPIAIVVGVVLGVGAMLFSSWLMYKIRKLNHEPVKDVTVPVGTEGTVYLKIPGNESGAGKIIVNVDGKQHILTAKTKQEEIKSFEKIRVTESNPLFVERLK